MLLLLLVLLTASTASAQYEEEEAPPMLELEGSSRFSLQTGWRYAPNTQFFDDYYSQVKNRNLTRAEGAIGGPLLTATFAYSPLEWLELGVDLFTTYERMLLTNKPGLNAMTFGALVGLRVQKLLEFGSTVLVPSVGVLMGPMFAVASFDGEPAVENGAQVVGGTVGATLRLGEKWGLVFEYRLLFGKGVAEEVGVYDALGNWFSVGMTYQLPDVPDRPMIKRFLAPGHGFFCPRREHLLSGQCPVVRAAHPPSGRCPSPSGVGSLLPARLARADSRGECMKSLERRPGRTRARLGVMLWVVLLGVSTPNARAFAQATKPDSLEARIPETLAFAATRLRATAESLTPGTFPQETRADSTWVTSDATSFTSGFFAGSLWYLYEYTKDPYWRTQAERWQAPLRGQEMHTDDHDLGFVLYSSFGNGYRLTGDPSYRDLLLTAAELPLPALLRAAGLHPLARGHHRPGGSGPHHRHDDEPGTAVLGLT